MFAATKVLHVAHLVGAKVFTGKIIVATTLFAGTVSTGYVVRTDSAMKYFDKAGLVVNDAALVESPASSPEFLDSERRQAEATLAASIDPSVPYLTVSASRMSRRERVNYDNDVEPVIQLSAK